jgi:hypothetical protein
LPFFVPLLDFQGRRSQLLADTAVLFNAPHAI